MVDPTGADDDPAPPLLDGASVAILVLGAVQPFATFLYSNATKIIRVGEVLGLAIGWTVLWVLVFLGIRTVTRQTRPAVVAIAMAVVSISFWNFGRWLPYEPETETLRWVAIGIWLLVTALGVVLAVNLASLNGADVFAALLLAVWVAGLTAGFALQRPRIDGGDPPIEYAGPAFGDMGDDPPDIYWFVLDEHARTDQLRKWTGYDNSWFGDELADRGFSVSETSSSAYMWTHLSISSTLSMEYLYEPGNDYAGEYHRVSRMLTDNPVLDALEANGYRFVFAPDGSVEWAACPEMRDGQTCIEPQGGLLSLREPFTPLIWSTPVGSLGLDLTRNDLGSVLAGLEEIDHDDPLFVMAHILSPHFPIRYEEDCTERDELLIGHDLTGEERAAAYANDVDCLDHELVDTIDELLADDPDAVIIVQSDHGSRLVWNSGDSLDETSADAMDERFAVLNAIRLPGACRDRPIEGEPLVNTFRLVLACLDGSEPDLLEQRTFFSEYTGLDTLVEVPADALGGT